MIPAHLAVLKFMREQYLPGARPTLAADDLPDGRAFYQVKIKEFTTLDLTPEQIHAIGVREVARIHAEMLATMKETGFKGNFPEFLQFLRTDPQFYAKTPDELLKDAAWIAKEFDGKAGQYFGYLPRGRFAIEPVPADMAPYYTSGRGGPGLYLVNTYDLPSRPLYNLTALTLHESATSAMPGRWPSPSNTRTSPSSGRTSISRRLGRAGRSIARSSAWKWACTRRRTSGSAC